MDQPADGDKRPRLFRVVLVLAAVGGPNFPAIASAVVPREVLPSSELPPKLQPAPQAAIGPLSLPDLPYRSGRAAASAQEYGNIPDTADLDATRRKLAAGGLASADQVSPKVETPNAPELPNEQGRDKISVPGPPNGWTLPTGDAWIPRSTKPS